MAAATEVRPETFGPMAFNKLLNEEMTFLDGAGKDVTMAFWAALNQADSVAKSLQERVVSRIEEYSKPESDKSKVSEEHQAFMGQVGVLRALTAKTEEVVANFKQMLVNYDANMDSGIVTAQRVMNKADVEEVRQKMKDLSAALTKNYLTGGTISRYLPDYLNDLKALAPAEEKS